MWCKPGFRVELKTSKIKISGVVDIEYDMKLSFSLTELVLVAGQVLGGLLGLEGAGVVSAVLVAAVARVAVAVVRVRDHLVALGVLLLGQQLLQGDDAGEDERQLADDEGLEGEEGEGAEGQGDEGGGLELEQQQEGQQHLQLLLLASGCNTSRETGA
ncbi:Hermansky-Pudlak syndrome 1 protein-like protein, partial [Frankliniella fusca]